MRTNIEIDEALIQEAIELTRSKTKREVVHMALRELIRMKKQRSILDLRGKINWDGNLDEMREQRG